MPHNGTGFVNLQNWLALNQGQGQKMAEGLAQPVEQAGQAAMAGMSNLDDPGQRQRAYEASEAANLMATPNGRAAALQKRSQAGYTTGMNAYDSALVGANGGNRFNDLKSQYGGLSGMFETKMAERQNAAMPQPPKVQPQEMNPVNVNQTPVNVNVPPVNVNQSTPRTPRPGRGPRTPAAGRFGR